MKSLKYIFTAVLFSSILYLHCTIYKVDKLNFIDKDCIYTQLIQICDKIMDWQVGSGRLENIHDNTATSIFINGNLARVLISTYELTGNREYLEEGLRYCRYLANYAIPVTTSKGQEAFWWYDMEKTKGLYLADTGTAMAALYKALPYLNEKERNLFKSRLDGFFRLITEGTNYDPTNQNLGASPGWVCADSGALGVGYYRGKLELLPYTVSTAQAGVLFATQYFQLTNNPEAKEMAVNAASWLLDNFGADGAMKYRIMGEIWTNYQLQANHYTIEALLCFFDSIQNQKLQEKWEKVFPRLLEFIMISRNDNGLWGFQKEYDTQRSMFLMSTLIKAMRRGYESEEIKNAISDGLGYLQSPQNAYSYGVNVLIRQTGFVGLVYADLLKEGITYSHPKDVVVPPNLLNLTQAAKELGLKMEEFEKEEFYKGDLEETNEIK